MNRLAFVTCITMLTADAMLGTVGDQGSKEAYRTTSYSTEDYRLNDHIQHLWALLDEQHYAEAKQEAERVDSTLKSTDPALRAMAKVSLARCIFETGGSLNDAKQLLGDALELVKTGPASQVQEWAQAQGFLWLGHVELELGWLEDAHDHYDHVASLAHQNGDKLTEAIAMYSLARLVFERRAELPEEVGDDEARKAATLCLNAAQKANSNIHMAQSHWLLAQLSQGAVATGHVDQCVRLAKLSKEPITERDCLGLRAKLLAMSDPGGSARAAQQADAMPKGDDRTNGLVAGALMRASWAQNSPDMAMAHWRSEDQFVEAIRRQQRGANQAEFFSTWTSDYYWLAGHFLEERPDPKAPEHAFEVIEHLRARTLRTILEPNKRPDRLSNLGTTSLGDLRASLRPDEALLSYQIGLDKDWTGDRGGGAWLTVVTHSTGIKIYPIHPDRGGLRTQLKRKQEYASVLVAELLEPALADLPPGIRRLILIPDDILYRLPFASLPLGPGAAPLVERFEHFEVPSATLFVNHFRAGKWPVPPLPLLALADPLPPDPKTSDEDLKHLPALPAAEAEAGDAAASLGPGSLVKTGRAVSERFLKTTDSLAPYAIVHFASHAVVNSERLEDSFLWLSPGAKGENGKLDIHEIASLRWDGKLVVLAACSTAGGKILRGEGVMSLAHAFFQAHARTVVASLKKIDDDDARELFAYFYRHLAGGESVAGALRSAQLEVRANGMKAWADFVVLGDGTMTPFPHGVPIRRGFSSSLKLPNVLTLLAFLALALLAYEGVSYLRRRRRRG